MKLISSIFFFSIFTSAFGQEWPWFFSETAFKKWLIEKDVKCLKYVSADLDFENLRTAKYWPDIRKCITSYYFDQEGVLENIKIEEIEISLLEDSDQTENNYYYIITELLPTMPLSLSESEKAKFTDYGESKYFPGIKIRQFSAAIAPDGTLFKDYRRVVKSDASFPFLYEYSLRQEIGLDKGEIISIKKYDYNGDFYIPALEFAEYVKLNDSVYVLRLNSFFNFDDYQSYAPIGKDTVINYPFYRKISVDEKRVELGIYVSDSAGTLCYFPLRQIFTDEMAQEKTQIINQIYDHAYQMLPITIYGGYGDYRFLCYSGISVQNNVLSELTCAHLFNYKDLYRKENRKIVTKLNKKTNEFSEKIIYSWENDDWRLISQETKTNGGYLQNHYILGSKKPVHQIKISSDANSNPVFTKIANEKEEIIFRISGDSIYLTRDENSYGHFLIEYE